jgi:uncharacterized protein
MIEPLLVILQPTSYCNINCSYCYLANRDHRHLMSDEVIEAIRNKLLLRLKPEIPTTIVWHAGEPLTAPIAWYEHAHERLSTACSPKTIFAMQTNGIGITNQWIRLFQRTGMEIGLSIDGPKRFHDARRRTRNGKPTWSLAMRGLARLQENNIRPRVITVLHPDGLDCADEYYEFYRGHHITDVGFSIDEQDGAHKSSSFRGRRDKDRITRFLLRLMESAYRDAFPLRIREVERIARILAEGGLTINEQIKPWASIVVAADGSVSTFSPELMEVTAPEYGGFVFGNILDGTFESFSERETFQRVSREVMAGTEACRSTCRYFAICGGGSPVNKYCEAKDMKITETHFCRHSIQTAADAFLAFLNGRRADRTFINTRREKRSDPEQAGFGQVEFGEP